MDEPISSTAQLLSVDQSKPIDLFPFFVAVARGKWIILGSAVIFAIAAWIYLLRVPARFESDVEILPPASRNFTASSLFSQGMGSDFPNIGALSATLQSKPQSSPFLIVLEAWPIQQALVRQFDLVQRYRASSEEDAIRVLSDNTRLTSDKDGFITIGIVDTDRKLAAEIANAYVDQARQFLRGLALSEASQRRLFFEAQLAKTKDDLAQAEANFQKMQQASGMISLDSQAKTLLETAAALRSQVTAKEVELQGLRSYSTESNAQVQILETELAALRRQLADVESRGQGGLTGKGLSSVPGTELEFVRATRELKYQEGLYELLTKQYEGSRIDEARDAPIIEVIEPARIPTHKFSPRRFRDVRIAAGIGLLLGFLAVTVRFLWGLVGPQTRLRLVDLRRTAFGL